MKLQFANRSDLSGMNEWVNVMICIKINALTGYHFKGRFENFTVYKDVVMHTFNLKQKFSIVSFLFYSFSAFAFGFVYIILSVTERTEIYACFVCDFCDGKKLT